LLAKAGFQFSDASFSSLACCLFTSSTLFSFMSGLLSALAGLLGDT
jgi:hypothetical protein